LINVRFFARDADGPDAVLNALAFKSAGTKPRPTKTLKEKVLNKDEIIVDAAKLEKQNAKNVRRDVE
jgi:hypothetical protein